MTERIRKDYIDDVDLGAKETNEDDAKKYEDIFNVFVLALRMKRRELTALTLDIIRRYQKSVYRIKTEDNDWRSLIIGYAEFADVLDKAEAGEITEMEVITHSFNPFWGSPSEMLNIYRSIARVNPAFQPVKNLFDGVREIVQSVAISSVIFSDAEELRKAVREYLLPWLDDFWPVLEENEEEFALSSFFCSSPLTEIVNCLSDFTYDSTFDTQFDHLFTFLKKCVDKYGWKYGDCSWLDGIIRNAVWHDEEHIFFTAFNEAERRGERIVFDTYPPKSHKILHAILERGELIPGTEEGKRAFYDVIRYYDVSPDVLKSILHPSYFEEKSADGVPLILAASNPDFNPKKYFYLLSEGALDKRMGLTALGWAYLRGDRAAADALLSLGADSGKKDERGNNILHYLLSLDGIDLLSLIDLVPPFLFLEENMEGKTPLHYYLSGDKVDYAKEYNDHRSVKSLRPAVDF